MEKVAFPLPLIALICVLAERAPAPQPRQVLTLLARDIHCRCPADGH
jgi:hypothetical protein